MLPLFLPQASAAIILRHFSRGLEFAPHYISVYLQQRTRPARRSTFMDEGHAVCTTRCSCCCADESRRAHCSVYLYSARRATKIPFAMSLGAALAHLSFIRVCVCECALARTFSRIRGTSERASSYHTCAAAAAATTAMGIIMRIRTSRLSFFFLSFVYSALSAVFHKI